MSRKKEVLAWLRKEQLGAEDGAYRWRHPYSGEVAEDEAKRLDENAAFFRDAIVLITERKK